MHNYRQPVCWPTILCYIFVHTARIAMPTSRRLIRCGPREDMRFATAESLDKKLAKFKVSKDEAEKRRHLKLTRLRVKASHEPSECKLIGIVDESGSFCPSVPST